VPLPSRRSRPQPAAPTAVLVALGSNRCHGRHGSHRAVVRAAVAALQAGGLAVLKVSPVIDTAPIGPSDRRFANAALIGRWAGTPQALLDLLKQTEAAFGRRRGRRWGARVLDCDLIAFGSAVVQAPGLTIPHPALHRRPFVLEPLLALWPQWRHPRLNLGVRHMAARVARRRPVD